MGPRWARLPVADHSAPASSDAEATPEKGKRMTTNKKKAENFYTHAVSKALTGSFFVVAADQISTERQEP